jgi:hypothetical protein
MGQITSRYVYYHINPLHTYLTRFGSAVVRKLRANATPEEIAQHEREPAKPNEKSVARL